MKLTKILIARILLLAMLLQLLPAAAPEVLGSSAQAAVADGFTTSDLIQDGSAFNGEGVWITEIYNNDTDRSTANNTRETNSYVSIDLFDSTSDLMEFVELCSTHDEDIKFNDLYEIGVTTTSSGVSHTMTVTTVDGSSDVTLTKGQPVVLWNYRTDVTATLPTEAQFRKALRIPDNALVLKATTGLGWDSNAKFYIKVKATGKTLCRFTTVNETNVLDGFAVELSLPLMGKDLEVYRNQTLPTPGYVYTRQVRGLIQANTLEGFDGKGVYITEVRPNDVNRSSSYGSASDFMECLEVVNTTDAAIDLNDDYKLVYTVKEGHRKILQLHKYSSSASNHVGSSSGCTIPAGGTAVIWCYRYSNITDATSFPTLANFRSAYGISSSTPVYIFTNQGSLNNTNRALEIFTANGSGLGDLVSSYTYIGAPDCPDNTSAHLQINSEGPEMLLWSAATASTMGTVDEAQTNFRLDYGDAIDMHLLDGTTVPTSLMQGEDLRVAHWYDFNSRTPRNATNTYYRFDGTGDWMVSAEGGIRVPNTYETVIGASELFDHDYVEFYVVNSNNFRDTVCGIYKVDIVSLNEVDGIRTNISEGEEVRGTVSITANDGGTNASTKIYIDGTQYTTTAMMEDGAWFSFLTDGVDAYFKDTLTTSSNKLIAKIGKWQYINPTAQLVHIDNSYFSYSSSKYNVTLRIWAGTLGTDVDQHMYPEGNRDDFKVSQLQLKLANGKTYLPTSIGPSTYNGVDTSGKTNLSTALDAVHSIGDSTNWCPYMNVKFSVPAADVNAVGVSVDTTNLSDGTHTLKVTNGTSTKTVTFVVDNTAPKVSLGFANGATLTGNIDIAPQITEANGMRELVTLLDGEPIQTPYATTARLLGEGSHTLQVTVTDMAGNQTTASGTFKVDGLTMSVTDAGSTNITGTTADLYLTAQSSGTTTATFYKALRIEAADISTATSGGLVPHIQYTLDVSDAAEGDDIVVNWDGTASGAGEAYANTLFVKNTVTGQWELVAQADASGKISGASFSVKDHAENGTATLIVQCTEGSSLPDLDTSNDGVTGNNAGWDGNSAPKDYDFSFAWISDTQGYVQRYNHHFMNMNQWIVDNREEWKISYVIHTGDIVDDWDAIYQWENADAAMKIFDEAGMPYGVLGGNHDVASGHDLRENYYHYFGEDRVKDQPTFGGSYENNIGHYDLVNQNGQEFIIIYMSWNIYEDEIDWMNEVLAKYSDRKAILCFHPYTHVNESVDGLLDYFGVMIQEHVVAKNPNVFATLNGHYSGSTYQTVRFDDNGDGKLDRTVYQICTDYQSVEQGGLEYIKFLYFDLDNDKVFINSYSPYMDDFNYFDSTTAHDMTAKAKASSTGVVNATDIDAVSLTLNFDIKQQSISEDSFSAFIATDEVLGSAPVNAATGKADLDATGLAPDTDYTWYAVLENSNTGYLRTDAYDLTTGHDYKAVTVAPTCTADGYTTYTCTGCGHSYQGNTVAATGHSWTAATCTSPKTCTVCYATEGTVADHAYNAVVTAPTCTEAGYTTYTCAACGYSYTGDTVAATGHSYGDWVTVKAPTCTEQGQEKQTCTDCGSSQLREVAPAGHHYQAVVTAPTCTEVGYTTYTCTCGDSYVDDYVDATDHRYGSWIQTVDPTCTEQGEERCYCANCDAFKIQRIEATGHSDVSVTTAPTCTEDGYTTHTCTVCSRSYTDSTVAATGHDYEAFVTAPTCTGGGYTNYSCSKCDDSYIADTVPATGHSYTDGKCTVCGVADPDYSPVKTPTLTMKYPSLSFEAEILYNVYFIAENIDDVVDMGLVTFDTEVADGTVENATDVIPGFVTDGTLWKVGTNGISAKNLGDTLYFRVYAQLSDGSYVYSVMKSYSAINYANTILNRASSSDYMKSLVVAMLNYGTEAQLYFGHNTDSLMNAGLTAEQQALVSAYDESMVDPVATVDTTKAKNFIYDGSSFARRAPTVSFDGAFAINYYFTAAKAPDDGMTLYYWTIDDYNAATTLTVDNATGSMEMLATGTANQFWGEVPGIAAKELDQTVFVAGVYESNGVTYTSGILNYSIGKYCEGLAAKDTSDQQAFAQATAVYGYCAKEYFANN